MMRVLLHRINSRRNAAQEASSPPLLFNVDRFTIGSDAGQLLQLVDPRIAPAHAVIDLHAGKLRLRAIGAAPMLINGAPRLEAYLSRGDVVAIADAVLEVENVRANEVLVLRLRLDAAPAAAELANVAALNLKDTGLRKAPYAWALALGVLGITLVVPLVSTLHGVASAPLRDVALLPSDALWLPGPLHPSHHFIGKDCNTCHRTPFKRVTDAACRSCHRSVEHHVAAISAARVLFSGKRCADCHIEHGKANQLIDRRDALCVTCHGDLPRQLANTTLQNVADFGHDHPDFSINMLEPADLGAGGGWQRRTVPAQARLDHKEHSNLNFSHKVHLDVRGIKSPQGMQVLTCQDCHRTDSSGRTMMPVRMESHCARCHELRYDENDATSVVPHGELTKVFTALQEHFSRMFLQSSAADASDSERRRPGTARNLVSGEQQRRALDWTRQQSVRAARELLEKRVCVECHTVTRIAGARDFEQWRVAPVRINASWMPRAQFNHAAHRTAPCGTCHHRAEQSALSSDVLMPRIGDCRSCHGAGDDSRRAASTCVTCHQFHRHGMGQYSALPSTGKAT
jgi:predicted CXXCH cytochrome family protein